MEQDFKKINFDMAPTKAEIIFLIIYFPIHLIGLPALFSYLQYEGTFAFLDDITVNTIYYIFGALMCLIFAHGLFRRSFDVLCDNFFRCLFTAVMGYILIMIANTAVGIIEMYLPEVEANLNEEEVESLINVDYGKFVAMAVFMAPIVEEALFRGLFFGAIRPKSRVLAYIISAGLFCLYHVWSIAIATQNWSYLLIALEYLPASLIICWSYDRTGSIWTPIMVHMMVNGISTYVYNVM